MNKIILVCYVNTAGLTTQEAYEVIKKVRKELNLFHVEDIIHYVIPNTIGDSRIECINPTIVSEVDYSLVKKRLDKITKDFEESLERIKKEVN